MSRSINTPEVDSSAQEGCPAASGVPAAASVLNRRHELVGAQVEVLRMYLEKQSRERMLGALERLIECTRLSFMEEEAFMEFFSGKSDPQHREMHREVLTQLDLLRRDVLDFDRGRLLAQLILVDRQLTSHLSEVVGVLESETFPPVGAEHAQQH